MKNLLTVFKTIKKTDNDNVKIQKPVEAEVIYEKTSGDPEDQGA